MDNAITFIIALLLFTNIIIFILYNYEKDDAKNLAEQLKRKTLEASRLASKNKRLERDIKQLEKDKYR